jgi:hypothetical protein
MGGTGKDFQEVKLTLKQKIEAEFKEALDDIEEQYRREVSEKRIYRSRRIEDLISSYHLKKSRVITCFDCEEQFDRDKCETKDEWVASSFEGEDVSVTFYICPNCNANNRVDNND